MMENAKKLLESGGYTCVLCGDGMTLTATERGVRPLAGWLREGKDLRGFRAADKVVGKAPAFLYCLLGVAGVYGRVMSRQALAVLREHGIAAEYDVLVEHIINRSGTGMCPFEEAVWEVGEPAQAWQIIRKKLDATQAGA